MNDVDEWLDSEGAERYALKFKNGCYIISGRGNGKSLSALEQMKRYLEDHPDAKIVMPYHHGYSYCKELINSVYGRKKSQHDDMPDAVRYAVEEFERKQREERLEKAKLTSEGLKEMLNNSRYGVCWPSELIESCERIDKYRKEEEAMSEHRVECGTVIVPNFDNHANRDGFWVIGDKVEEFGNVGFMAYRIPNDKVLDFMALPKMLRVVNMDCYNWPNVKLCYISNEDSDDIPDWHYVTRKEVDEMRRTLICSDAEFIADLHLPGRAPEHNKKISAKIYAYDDCSGLDIRLKFFAGQEWCFVVHISELDTINAYFANAAMFDCIANRIYNQTNREIRIGGTPSNLSCVRHIVEEYDLFKTRKAKDSTKKETTEMKGYKFFMVPKGAFGSKVYIQAKDSDKITYAGTMTDMHLETASGCEMHGNIDFIADDEPVEKLAGIDRGFIKNVVFHDPATIVEWKDGSKTVVQVRDGEKFDPEKGLAMAISKKAMGNKRDYYHVFKHYLKKVKTESVCGEKVKTITVPEELAYDVMQFLKEKMNVVSPSETVFSGEKEGK